MSCDHMLSLCKVIIILPIRSEALIGLVEISMPYIRNRSYTTLIPLGMRLTPTNQIRALIRAAVLYAGGHNHMMVFCYSDVRFKALIWLVNISRCTYGSRSAWLLTIKNLSVLKSVKSRSKRVHCPIPVLHAECDVLIDTTEASGYSLVELYPLQVCCGIVDCRRRG